MNKFLLYFNSILESLDIPTIANSSPKKVKSPSEIRSKNHLKE